MTQITIDNQKIDIPEGSTVLKAAEQAGIQIPTLCFLKEYDPSTSCMVCVVQIEGFASLMPACATRVQEGMVIHTDTDEVLKARRTALELLLSDHSGDCEGPCRIGCPTGMDIPRMIRQIIAGDLTGAIETVKQDIALPAVLGRICPAPCEKVCRRSQLDEPIAVCLLKRYVADVDLECDNPYRPECAPASGKKVAVVGAGPCGLSAAYSLARMGHRCVLFDRSDSAGGLLRSVHIDRQILPLDVLDREISQIFGLGIEFRGTMDLGTSLDLDGLKREYNAVFLAIGSPDYHKPVPLDLIYEKQCIRVKKSTYQTSADGVFAGGGVIGSRKMAVRACADGKEAAYAIDQYLKNQPITGQKKDFNSRLGQLNEEEWKIFCNFSDSAKRQEVSENNGFTDDQAVLEAERCLKCDCKKKKNCQLRVVSHELDVRQNAYKGHRRTFARVQIGDEIVFESSKCIQCGLCIQALENSKADGGLTFGLRGFEMQVTTALDQAVERIGPEAAAECVKVCPTGAWSFLQEP